MKVQINEVWNAEGKTIGLTIIETSPMFAREDVYDWVKKNRPDLMLADTLNAHGFHAKEVQS